ncbi:Uncharacterized protein Adt_29587 [Abeliophyllum distichum]|uniref:Uncharacterized protein n=1 Tax=Abeliophyllum distichum TaxID=126358 RepID=A0ABD1R9Q1_9LAMI
MKGYARSLHVNSIGVSSKFGQSVTFNDDDLEGVSLPHDDVLVITGDIADFDVRRVLVDTGNAANVMSWEAFKVCIPMAYNSIYGRPIINSAGAIISTQHQCMKFSTGRGIGIIQGDQLTSRWCYVDSIRHEAVPIVLMIEKNEFPQAQRFEPAEEVETVEH